MRQREWFELGARLLGLWLMVGVVDQLLNIFNMLAMAFSPVMALVFVIQLLAHLAVAAFLLMRTRILLNLVYGRDSSPPDRAAGQV